MFTKSSKETRGKGGGVVHPPSGQQSQGIWTGGASVCKSWGCISDTTCPSDFPALTLSRLPVEWPRTLSGQSEGTELLTPTALSRGEKQRMLIAFPRCWCHLLAIGSWTERNVLRKAILWTSLETAAFIVSLSA